MSFVVKASDVSDEFPSGMSRDSNEGKARFDLLRPVGIPYADQFITRVAMHLAKGAARRGERNWENANSDGDVARCREAAERHLHQWLAGDDTDEDHAAAVVANILFAESTAWKIRAK